MQGNSLQCTDHEENCENSFFLDTSMPDVPIVGNGTDIDLNGHAGVACHYGVGLVSGGHDGL